MDAKIAAVIVIWVIIGTILFFIIRKTLYWKRMPKTMAVITDSELCEGRSNHHREEYWMVTYLYIDPERQAERMGQGRWYKKGVPMNGSQITISYDPKGKKGSVIEGTYTVTGVQLMVIALLIWGIVSTAVIMAGIDVSRRPYAQKHRY